MKLNDLFKEWADFDRHVNQVADDYEISVLNGTEKTVKSGLILFAFTIMGLTDEFLAKLTDYESTVICFHLYKSSFEGYTRGIIPAFFKVFEYSDYWGVFILTMSFYRAVAVNFSDVFLIIMYSVICTKLKKFNDGISRMKYMVRKNLDCNFCI